MIALFIKKQSTAPTPEESANYRKHCVAVCSAFGVILNLVLFAFKFIAGLLTGSIAIRSDAFNNLSDSGSSIISYFGVKLASKKPDPEHPFGHGRIEYLSALAISVVIIYMAIELAKESIMKIISPSAPDPKYFYLTLIILVLSVLTKIYMWSFNRKYGKMVKSGSLLATAMDSLSDSLATVVVLISTVVSHTTGIYILDGICGLLVSGFVFFAGFRSAKETLVPILGQPPEKEFLDQIKTIVLSYEPIVGIHDLIVHDYGPGRVMVSLHAEVPCQMSVLDVHEAIDNAEIALRDKLGCNAVIHYDPIDYDNPATRSLKLEIEGIIERISPDLSIHDFRVVHGSDHTNLIFDLVMPINFSIPEQDVCKMIRSEVLERHDNHFCVIQVDVDYSK